MSGIAQFVAKNGLDTLKTWCDEGYGVIQEADKAYTDWLAIPRSIKTTCIKPSGTVSLLAGATPGMHYPEARYYIRRVRLSVHSELLPALRAAGYHIEPDAVAPTTSVVVAIPVDVGAGVRTYVAEIQKQVVALFEHAFNVLFASQRAGGAHVGTAVSGSVPAKVLGRQSSVMHGHVRSKG